MNDSSDATHWLLAWRDGDLEGRDHLVAAVYGDLRRLAGRLMGSERADHTLEPTALVHEVYLRLVDVKRVDWQGRAHFIAVAVRIMRQVLVDHAREHNAAKRGGGATMFTLSRAADAAVGPTVDVLDLDRALAELEEVDPERCRLVELRWLGGLTVEEAAEVMGLSARTVKRRWRSTRAWLERRLSGGGAEPVGGA